MSSPKFIVGKPNRWNRLTQQQKVGVLVLVVVGLVFCAIGVVILLNEPSTPVQVSQSWFQGWGIYEWLFRGIIPLLLLGSIYVLIIHKSSDLLKFTAGFIVLLIVVIGVGKGVSAAWNWVGSLFSGSSASSSNTPGTGFAKHSANSNSTSTPKPKPTPASPAPPSLKQSIDIPNRQYSAKGWSEGPGVSSGGGNETAHIWMVGSGEITYSFNSEVSGKGTAAPRMSAYGRDTAGDQDRTKRSNLIVSINGEQMRMVQIRPFNGDGVHYTLEFPVKVGKNWITFTVNDGNGLAIYSPISISLYAN